MILTKNIKEYCKENKKNIKSTIEKFKLTPQLAIIQMGENEASNRYIRNKIKDCNEVGIKADHYFYKENQLDTFGLIVEIKDLQEHYDGIIVQLPLPEHIDAQLVTMAIDPKKDVDGFHPMSYFNPCTPKGIVDYLTFGCHWNPRGKNVTIIGRSNIVGKPLAKMFIDLDATVTLCHSKTKDLWEHIDTADLVVSAVGKPQFLNCAAIHKPVIDVGINFDKNGKLVGDCFNTENRDVTPVPGGVGLLTRVALLENVVDAC